MLEHVRALLSITPAPHSNTLATCFRSRLFAARTYPCSAFNHAYSLLEHILVPFSNTPALCCKTGAQASTRRRTPSHRSRSLPSYVSELRTTRRKTAPPRKMATRRETAPRHSKPFSTSRLTQQFGCVEIPKTTRCISTRLQTFGIGKLLGISLSRDRFSSTFAQINSSSRVPLLC